MAKLIFIDNQTNLFAASSTHESFSVPATNTTAARTLRSNTGNEATGTSNNPFTNPHDMFDEPSDHHYVPAHIRAIQEECQNPALGFQECPFIGSTASRETMPHSLPSRREARQTYADQAQTLQCLSTQDMASQYRVMPQYPFNPASHMGMQTTPGVGRSGGFPQLTGPSTSAQPRLADVSPGNNHRRRHSRTNSRSHVAANIPGSTGSNLPRGGGRGNRRSRASHTVIPQIFGRTQDRISTYQQEALSAPLELSLPNETTGLSRDYYEAIIQEREAARRLQLDSEQMRAMVERIHADNVGAISYEESIIRRFQNDMESLVPPSHPKGLDVQNDGRPEPKETKDLSINLECRVCMSQFVDTVLLPCGHAILCRWCAEQHMLNRADRLHPKARAPCPICRTPVKHKVRNLQFLLLHPANPLLIVSNLLFLNFACGCDSYRINNIY